MLHRLLPLLLLAAATLGVAGERTHRVRGGESASSIAQQHYGDAELGPLLLLANGKSGTVIRVGETLRVPYCEIHRVRPGDTWSQVSARYLGKASLYPAVAALNGMEPERPLTLGDEIVMPVVLTHRLERGETLTRLAERFYGDGRAGEVLRTFNRIDDPRRLSMGRTLEIPLVSLRLRDELRVVSSAEPDRAESESKETTPPQSGSKEGEPKDSNQETTPTEPVARYAGELRAAARAFDDGDYEGARERLEALREPVGEQGTAADRAELGRLLAFVYVAFDLPEDACVAYRSAREARTDDPALDDDLVSPKIREVLARCGDGTTSS
jgi:LysM repeat protein